VERTTRGQARNQVGDLSAMQRHWQDEIFAEVDY